MFYVLRELRSHSKSCGEPINWIETRWHVVSLKEQSELTI